MMSRGGFLQPHSIRPESRRLQGSRRIVTGNGLICRNTLIDESFSCSQVAGVRDGMIRHSAMVSFVVCTHNGGDRLIAVVGNLLRRYSSSLAEVVVVDNASTDNAVNGILENVPSSQPLRVVREERLGLTYARLAGVAAAQGEVVVFVDDDNLLLDGWLEILLEIFWEDPTIGACGGYGIGCLPSIVVPPWFVSRSAAFAVGSQADEPGDVTDYPGHLWGAGLAIRKIAVEHLLAGGFRFRANDRSGSRLTSGGDTELCFALRLAGWRLWYEPRLVFMHLLSEGRFQGRYLEDLHRGFGAGSVLIDPYEWAVGDTIRFPTRRHRSVGWQLALALRTIVSPSVITHRSPHTPREFVVAKYRGRLAQLLRMGPAYDRSFAEIANAPWRADRPL